MSLKIIIKYSSTQVKIGNLRDSFELQLVENVKFKIFNENIDYIRYAFDKYSNPISDIYYVLISGPVSSPRL